MPGKENEQATPAQSKGTRLSAREIHDNILADAKNELRRPGAALAWSGLAAGLTIGFSALAAAYLASLVAPPMKGAANAAGYPLGFVFVVLARNQLFTENTLEPIIPLLARPTMRLLRQVLGLWGVVLAANLAGAALLALVLARSSALAAPVWKELLDHARESTSAGFGRTAYLAIFAGWLVALMAWLIASTRATGAQIAVVWLTTGPISALGFCHSIAGSVSAFARVFAGDAGLGAMVGGFIVPALLGNIVGGVALVALLNHGQVTAGKT